MTKYFIQQFFAPTTLCASALCILVSAPVVAVSPCESLKGCDKKFCEIEAQLNVAQEKGNERKVDGLKKSLKEAKSNCSNQGLHNDLVKKLADSKKDLAEYEADLKEAEEDGKAKKALKYQKKIADEQVKIKLLEHELAGLK